jgi:hypothetical protein
MAIAGKVLRTGLRSARDDREKGRFLSDCFVNGYEKKLFW